MLPAPAGSALFEHALLAHDGRRGHLRLQGLQSALLRHPKGCFCVSRGTARAGVALCDQYSAAPGERATARVIILKNKRRASHSHALVHQLGMNGKGDFSCMFDVLQSRCMSSVLRDRMFANCGRRTGTSIDFHFCVTLAFSRDW